MKIRDGRYGVGGGWFEENIVIRVGSGWDTFSGQIRGWEVLPCVCSIDAYLT